MASRSPTVQAWTGEFRRACRARGMRFVREEGFVIDGGYIATVAVGAFHPEGDVNRLRLSATFTIKPLAVDDILWAAFLPPDTFSGPRMRMNRRVNGAFQIRPLPLGERTVCDVAATQHPDWTEVLDAFDCARRGFTAAHPDAAGFLAACRSEPDRGCGWEVTRMVTALIAADRRQEAAALARASLARGEGGSMFSAADVLEYLAAYADGPQAHNEFLTTLIPTHDYQVLSETQPNRFVSLSRHRHLDVASRALQRLDGTDPWAVVLSLRTDPHDAVAVRYIQAAGCAEAMVVEVRQPGGGEMGAVSVRSVVGHAKTVDSPRDVAIPLPRSTEMIAPHEVFAAAEATILFEAFFHTGGLPDGYALRPVEGYTSSGGFVCPPGH